MANKKYIVDYITEDEVRCKCPKCKADPSRYPIVLNQQQLEFFQKLSAVRRMRGIPMIIKSGFRCPDHPESVINPMSAHCLLMAVDFYEPGMPLYETYRFYDRAMPWNGIGYNPKGNTLHLDDKPGRFGRWAYIKKVKQGKCFYAPEYMIIFSI